MSNTLLRNAGPELQEECALLAPLEFEDVIKTSGYGLNCKEVYHCCCRPNYSAHVSWTYNHIWRMNSVHIDAAHKSSLSPKCPMETVRKSTHKRSIYPYDQSEFRTRFHELVLQSESWKQEIRLDALCRNGNTRIVKKDNSNFLAKALSRFSPGNSHMRKRHMLSQNAVRKRTDWLIYGKHLFSVTF